ncbi:MAG: phospholipase D family protein, partial [Actinomycetota bacterium]|nr:phospholipase D family protein [Actinomycetota bacterium]
HVVSEMAGLPSEHASASQGILTGLHAKLYVVEQGWNARLFIGSANATDAAFGGNTELLVELAGRRKAFGVDTMIGADAAFRTILEPYQRQPAVERDEDRWRLENYLRDVASIALTATVQPGDDDDYLLTVTGERDLLASEGMGLLAELLTRRGEAVKLSPGTAMSAQFGPLLITDVTPFVVLTAKDDGGRSLSAVVRASLVGDPSGRLDEILARQVDTPEKFLRFLALLLGLGSQAILPEGTGGADGEGSWTGVTSPGILELLMRGLVDQPKQLDDLARLVERLAATERGRQLLPTGFAQLWAVIDQVRRELGETRTS